MRLGWLVLVGFAAVGCGGASASPASQLPVAKASPAKTISAGDVLTISVVGEPNWAKDYEVNSDGTIDFPHIGPQKVSGMETYQVVALLKKKLQETRILDDAQISIVTKASIAQKSNSVTVVGQVAKPNLYAFAPGMTITKAISEAGWFTPLADSKHVGLTRTGDDRTVRIEVNVDNITERAKQDIPLQPGDIVDVPQRVF